MQTHQNKVTNRSSERGFGLVNVMVAMGILSFVIAGASAYMQHQGQSARRTQDVFERQNVYSILIAAARSPAALFRTWQNQGQSSAYGRCVGDTPPGNDCNGTLLANQALDASYTNLTLLAPNGNALTGNAVSYTKEGQRCNNSANANCPMSARARFLAICQGNANNCQQALTLRILVEYGQLACPAGTPQTLANGARVCRTNIGGTIREVPMLDWRRTDPAMPIVVDVREIVTQGQRVCTTVGEVQQGWNQFGLPICVNSIENSTNSINSQNAVNSVNSINSQNAQFATLAQDSNWATAANTSNWATASNTANSANTANLANSANWATASNTANLASAANWAAAANYSATVNGGICPSNYYLRGINSNGTPYCEKISANTSTNITTLTSYHGGARLDRCCGTCNGGKLLDYMAACSRFCIAHGYTGGLMNECEPATNSANCLCSR